MRKIFSFFIIMLLVLILNACAFEIDKDEITPSSQTETQYSEPESSSEKREETQSISSETTQTKKDSIKSTEAKSKTVILTNPQNVKYFQSGDKNLITWEPVDGAERYEVYRSSTETGEYKPCGEVTGTFFSDSKTTKDTYYYIKAKTDGMDSKKSTPIKVQSNAKQTEITKSTESIPTDSNGYKQSILSLVNKERSDKGLTQLSLVSTLVKPANTRAEEIITKFDHVRPNGTPFNTVFSDYGLNFNAGGENIAYGQDSPQEVMTGWMNSPGHRANILNSQFNKLGVGVEEKNGTLYWVQLFTN